MHKRYIVVMIVMIIVGVLVWKLSSSYALYNQGYTGQNIIKGNNWALNIVKVNEPVLEGEAYLVKDVSTIGTTLNFEVALPQKDSSITFDFEVENMGKLEAELYALTLTGLNTLDSEFINYEIIPLDYVTIKTPDLEGSCLKQNEKHRFQIKVSYQDNVNDNNVKLTTLNLSSTIIYEEK